MVMAMSHEDKKNISNRLANGKLRPGNEGP